MIKMRSFPESNYFSVWKDGKTVRFQIEDDLPITELEFPEFYDVKITDYCSGGCPYCYQSSTTKGGHVVDALDKLARIFGTMTPNQRPFQIALGGGNPNEHPEFYDICELLDHYGITPNYTTNGIGLSKDVLDATWWYCGGVALSCHPHLEKYWSKAIDILRPLTDSLNLHLIISDHESIDEFAGIYTQYKDMIDYFVLLPYSAQGRAKEKAIAYDYLAETLDDIRGQEKIAFGANFYEFLLTKNYPVSIYEPEIMSKYIDLSNMKMYKSSFSDEVVKELE